jgi:hypothetical protein
LGFAAPNPSASEPMWTMSPIETAFFLSSLVLLLAILLLA